MSSKNWLPKTEQWKVLNELFKQYKDYKNFFQDENASFNEKTKHWTLDETASDILQRMKWAENDIQNLLKTQKWTNGLLVGAVIVMAIWILTIAIQLYQLPSYSRDYSNATKENEKRIEIQDQKIESIKENINDIEDRQNLLFLEQKK